ncbi:hypothetical protein EI94DRAFT_1705186 [Lactarius quietus]|nr:hypothetical protein EI94DRAFT_1705186 [Lactarius quietus]
MTANFCPSAIQGVCALRGKGVVEFVEAYDFEMPDTCILLPLYVPLLAPSGESGTYLSDYFGGRLERTSVVSSEDVVDSEQVVEEATVRLEGGFSTHGRTKLLQRAPIEFWASETVMVGNECSNKAYLAKLGSICKKTQSFSKPVLASWKPFSDSTGARALSDIATGSNYTDGFPATAG